MAPARTNGRILPIFSGFLNCPPGGREVRCCFDGSWIQRAAVACRHVARGGFLRLYSQRKAANVFALVDRWMELACAALSRLGIYHQTLRIFDSERRRPMAFWRGRCAFLPWRSALRAEKTVADSCRNFDRRSRRVGDC